MLKKMLSSPKRLVEEEVERAPWADWRVVLVIPEDI